MTNRMQKIGSLGVLILLNGLLAGCGGIVADSNGKEGGTVASVPMAEKSGTAASTHQGMNANAGQGVVGVGSAHGDAAASMPQGMNAEAAPNPGLQQIVIDNFTFSPAKLTVAVGSQVTWVNHDDVPHTVTSTAKPKLFDSGTMDTDDQFSHVFAAPGTYNYFCAVHPHMTAQIIVK